MVGNIQGKADILPGTRFVRIWKDRRYEVLAHENGFEYEGQMFRSLSAVAREITGTRWNGRRQGRAYPLALYLRAGILCLGAGEPAAVRIQVSCPCVSHCASCGSWFLTRG